MSGCMFFFAFYILLPDTRLKKFRLCTLFCFLTMVPFQVLPLRRLKVSLSS